MKNIVCFLLFFKFGLAWGQTINLDTKPVFGEIPIEEIQMKHYRHDTTAKAVVLLDWGRNDSQFDNVTAGFSGNFTHHVRIKIFKKSAYSYADVVIPLITHKYFKEKIITIKAKTYTLENGVLKTYDVDDKSIFYEKTSANRMNVKFTFPQVKEGSIIEYACVINSITPRYRARHWSFDGEIPVIRSEYQVPFSVKNLHKLHGNPVFALQQTFIATESDVNIAETFTKDKILGDYYKWIMTEAPAVKLEPFIDSPKNIMKWIGTNLFATTLMQYWLFHHESFGKQLESFSKLITLRNKMRFNEPDAGKALSKIFDAYRKEITWDKEDGIYAEKGLEQALKDGTGNVAEVNLLLTLLLLELGFNANPVVLNTRDQGLINPADPYLGSLNYVICRVIIEDKEYLLDATTPYLSTGVLPEKCINGFGLFIPVKVNTAQKQPWFIALNTEERKTETLSVEMKIDAEQLQLSGKISLTDQGYAAAEMREIIAKDGVEKFKVDFRNKHSTWTAVDVKLENIENLYASPKLTCQATINDIVQTTGERLFFNPLLLMGLNSSPFMDVARKYPVDFIVNMDTHYHFVFQLPTGYNLESSPLDMDITMPEKEASFVYKTKVTDTQVIVESHIKFDKAIFEIETYAALRQFYNQIIAKHAEQMVLKKIN